MVSTRDISHVTVTIFAPRDGWLLTNNNKKPLRKFSDSMSFNPCVMTKWGLATIAVIFILDPYLCAVQPGKASSETHHPGKIWEKVAPEDYWCNMKCPPGTRHTMCEYSEQTSTPFCWDISNKMNASLRAQILLWHNDLRDDVAGGSLGKQASNMGLLSWDFELEQVANRWAHQCFRTKDSCRSTEHYQRVSQNVGWVDSHVGQEPPPTEKILEQWAATKEQYLDAHKNSYFGYQRSNSPFTNLIRACHEKVGCGEVTYIQGELKRRFLACNYAPGGCLEYDSYGDQNDSTGTTRNKAFLVGKPCSRCHHGFDCHSYNTHFKNLCLRWYSNKDETLFSPLELLEGSSSSKSNKFHSNHLENACSIYKNLQLMPKELRQSEGNCSDMVNIMFKFLETMHLFINDKSCHDTIEKSRFCKAAISLLFPRIQKLVVELRSLDADVVRVELGLFKAIWSLKKPKPSNDDRGTVASCDLASSVRITGRNTEPTQRMSVSSQGVSSSSHEETPLSTTSLIATNHLLHLQFEDTLARFQGNFEDIKKCYDKLDTKLPAI